MPGKMVGETERMCVWCGSPSTEPPATRIFSRNQPFTAPAITPLTMCFWQMR